MQNDIAVRHQVYLEMFKSLQERDLRAFLRDVNLDMKKQIRLLESDISNYNKKDLIKKIKELQTLFRDALLSYETEFFLNLHDLRDYNQEFLKQAAKNDGFIIALPSERESNSAMFDTAMILGGIASGYLISSLYQDFVNQELKRIANSMQLAYANNSTNKAVLDILDSNVRITDKNAKTVVNTIIQHASFQVLDIVAKKNPSVFKMVVWVSVLDSRTSAVCRGLSGKNWLVTEPHPVPPQHFNCRSSLRYVYANESDIMQDTTYYQWLKGQDRSFIESVIGQKRTKLFLEGGLSVERFQELQLNKRFEPRTLKELEKLIPNTFKGI